MVKLFDFAHPERNRFTAINQFRINTPSAVKQCIIPNIVLFVNGIPLAVVECKIGGPTCTNPMHEAFVQLLRDSNDRVDTATAGLREGEPRLFHPNLLLIRTCGEKADYGTITSVEEHYFSWNDILPERLRLAALDEAKIADLRWHDLRHTFATGLMMHTGNLKIVQEACGHANITMTARYAHVSQTDLSKAMASLNRH